jgi:hypothetical protein
MMERGDIPLNALEADNGQLLFPLERNILRENIDPESRHLRDADIDRILRVVHGDLMRAGRRCILFIEGKGRAHKNGDLILWARKLMSRLENGMIKLKPGPEPEPELGSEGSEGSLSE